MAKRKRNPSAKNKVNGVNSKNALVDLNNGPILEPESNLNKNNNGIIKKVLITFFAVFLAFNIVELFVFMGKAMHKDKYPALVGTWPHNYKGCTSIGEYGDMIYAVDNTRGDVYINNKTTGKAVRVLNFKEGVCSALQDSKGFVYVLTRNSGILKLDPKNYSVIAKYNPENSGPFSWMDIDSGDNFFLVNPTSDIIYKFDNNFKKTISFGGQGDGPDGFFNAGKIFTGPDGELYAMNFMKKGGLEIKIFSSGGKILENWPVKEIKNFDSLTNMAVASNGDAYINDTQKSRICVFNMKGKFLGSFSGTEDKTFMIQYAASVTGGKNGLIYVFTYNIGIFKNMDYTK
jgi:hypothetical protein